jgi:hypothetical protein
MNVIDLRRICGSIGGQRQAIDRSGAEAIDLITPAAAIGFGVIPLQTDGDTIVCGTVPDINPDCAPALQSILGKRVEFVPFDDAVVREAITEQYLRPREGAAAGLDLATFESGEFLREPASARKLMSEKDGALPERDITVPPGRIALIDVRVHSVLRSMDRARRIEFAPTPAAIPFKADGDEAVLFRENMPDARVRAIVAQSLFYDGDEHQHGLSGVDLTALPHVLHPSELQLAEIDGNEARFWVYDRLETARASDAAGARPVASWSSTYWFLHFGARFKRTLRLDVLSFRLVRRAKLRLARRTDRIAPADLQRIFGLDFPRG